MKNLTEENFIELCKMRLRKEGTDFTVISIEDATFKYFNGVAFIVSSDVWQDDRFPFHFDMFYPDEFMYLLSLGVKF